MLPLLSRRSELGLLSIDCSLADIAGERLVEEYIVVYRNHSSLYPNLSGLRSVKADVEEHTECKGCENVWHHSKWTQTLSLETKQNMDDWI